MLSLNKISKSFPQRGVVLDELDLEVSKGQTIAIMGPSGSGKTTLMNFIGLLDKPDSGEIIFNGLPLNDFNGDSSAEYRNRNIGFVFQDHLLLPYLNINDNIALPLLASERSEEELEMQYEYIDELMERTGLAELKNKFPYQVSGGEAQRAALIRALVNKPSLLLADEPTGSLDSKNAENMSQLLLEMNRNLGISLIVATHSYSLAQKMSCIFYLENGKLIEKAG